MKRLTNLPDYLVSVVSRYVDSSKITGFALKSLGLIEGQLEMIRRAYFDDEKCINFEVKICFQNSLFVRYIIHITSLFVKFKYDQL